MPQTFDEFLVLQKQILGQNWLTPQVVQIQKSFQLQESSPAAWPEALPLDTAGGSATSLCYRFAVRAHHMPQNSDPVSATDHKLHW